MRIIKLSTLVIVCIFVLVVSGCTDEMKDLKSQNNSQRKLIAELESQIRTTELALDMAKRQLKTAANFSSIETDKLNQKITALEQDIEKKKDLIARMQQQLLFGVALPVELSTMLEDFAASENMVTYDPDKGLVKFKSDLVFDKGSDKITSSAANTIKSLCAILNNNEAQQFDIIVAGHTDDIPIRKPSTKAKHRTNWHLSSHRAISVLKLMNANDIATARLSTRGFGEFRPVAANKAGKKGNPQNRRVEIYIIGKGL